MVLLREQQGKRSSVMFTYRGRPVKQVNAFLLVLIPAMLSIPVLAQEEGRKLDRFKINLGAFFIRNTETTVRLDQSNGLLGSTVNYERDLDVDDSDDVARLSGYWRFKPRHKLLFDFYDVERDGTATTTRDLEFGDVTFPAGSLVESFFDQETLKLSYVYSFFQDERIELGVGGGLHVTELDTGIRTLAATPPIAEQADGTAPLPVLTARMDFKLNPKLALLLNWDFFFIEDKDGEYEGSWTD
ncbi:MAG: hypothetical protein ACE5FE_06275, partial [Acidiferrobacterales bacterium]